MIRLIGVEGKIFVLDLASDMEGTISLTGGISKDVDENICTLEELKYIETSFKTKRVSMSSGDYTKLLAALEDKQSGGGTASYPSLTGNADKVLTVTSTEDGVEWTTAATQVYVDTQDSLLQDQIDLKANAMATSQSLALKADLIGGLIPASQLPSYVDDVLSFPDLVSFPSLGEDGKIYIAEDVNKTYRWGGSSYVEIGGGGVALGETSSTAYRGDNGKIAYDHSQSQGNPHNTTTSDINEGTKLFFTESRVNQTVLTGLNTSTATPALATDQLLVAIGKLQAQINNLSGGITWVDVKTIGTINSLIDNSYTKIEVAKINGMLWLRGVIYFSVSSFTGSIFTITDPNYFLTIKRPAAYNNYYNPSTSSTNISTFKVMQTTAVGVVIECYILVSPTGSFYGLTLYSFNSNLQYLGIPAAPIGQLLN